MHTIYIDIHPCDTVCITHKLPLNFHSFYHSMSQWIFTLNNFCSHQPPKFGVCYQTSAYKNVGTMNFYLKSILCRSVRHTRTIFLCFSRRFLLFFFFLSIHFCFKLLSTKPKLSSSILCLPNFLIWDLH